MSNISVAGGSSSGGQTFEIMWERDSNVTSDYMVVFQELDETTATDIQILMAVRNTNCVMSV